VSSARGGSEQLEHRRVGHAAALAHGLQAVAVALGAQVKAGGSPLGADYVARYGTEFPNQGIGAEMIADQWGLSRTQLDELSLASHERAAAATDSGAFEAEIAPVSTAEGTIGVDEGIRRGGTLEKLATLQPAFREGGKVTAANSSQISDGASALLVTTSEKARELGLTPVVRVHTAVVVGAPPMPMLTGPIPATAKALARAGLSIGEIGAFEVNEAFASVPLAWLAETGADPKSLNPLGGAIALGHPLGASGGRLMTTLVHHMRANGIRYGLQTMCEGGGQANATILELV
jgi:acetyl-CoA acyltransferase